MRITATSSGTLAGVAKELERAALRAQKDAARTVGREARKLILDDVRRSRGTLRTVGGARLGVKTTVDATAVTSSVELRAQPAGPWAIVERGARSHTIRPRRRDVLAVARGDVIGEHANHPGTRGRPYWQRATDRLPYKLDPLVEDIVDDAMRSA